MEPPVLGSRFSCQGLGFMVYLDEPDTLNHGSRVNRVYGLEFTTNNGLCTHLLGLQAVMSSISYFGGLGVFLELYPVNMRVHQNR